MSGDEGRSAPPLLRLVRGTATPEQLAAVVAVLAARSGGSAEEEQVTIRPLWAAPQLRGSLTPGPGAWRASGLQR